LILSLFLLKITRLIIIAGNSIIPAGLTQILNPAISEEIVYFLLIKKYTESNTSKTRRYSFVILDATSSMTGGKRKIKSVLFDLVIFFKRRKLAMNERYIMIRAEIW
jgi:hypothetical protein